MNDADLYDVMHASTSDEIPPDWIRSAYAEKIRADMLRDALTLIYATVREVEDEHFYRRPAA